MQKNSNKKRDGFLEKSRSLGDMLPAPAILESYEEIKPGMVDELITMVKKEQKHRHAHEIRALQAQVYTTRFGQLLAFALSIIIIYTAITFATDSMYLMALAVLVCGFGFLGGVHFIPKFLENRNKFSGKFRGNAFQKHKRAYNNSNRGRNTPSHGSSNQKRPSAEDNTNTRRRIHNRSR